jgi:dolichol kinase
MLGLFNFTLGIIFIIFSIVFLKVASLNFKERHAEGSWSGLLASVIALIIGIYFCVWGGYGLLNQTKLTEIAPILPIPYPLGFYVLAFIPVIIVFIGLYTIREMRKEKQGTSPDSVKMQAREIHPLDLEISRKAFHITIIGILVCYLFLGELTSNAFFGYLEVGWDIWHITQNLAPPLYLMGRAFCLFMIAVIFLLLVLTDFVRLFAPKYYPVKMIGNVYREKEKSALGPHIHLAIGVIFAVIFFSPPIAMAVIAMAALGDAAATIVGISIGKHKINAKSKKSWEGCIGGVAVSFGTGFLCMIVLVDSITMASITAALILCGVGALIFFIIDYYTPTVPLTDNIMNPVCIGLVMTGLAYAFFPVVL